MQDIASPSLRSIQQIHSQNVALENLIDPRSIGPLQLFRWDSYILYIHVPLIAALIQYNIGVQHPVMKPTSDDELQTICS